MFLGFIQKRQNSFINLDEVSLSAQKNTFDSYIDKLHILLCRPALLPYRSFKAAPVRSLSEPPVFVTIVMNLSAESLVSTSQDRPDRTGCSVTVTTS